MLTPVNVNSATFGKLFSYPVDGYIYGQPLYLANVEHPRQGHAQRGLRRDAARQRLRVRCGHEHGAAMDGEFLDAGVTTVPNADVGCGQIVPEIGITSTPVIDAASRHDLRRRHDQGIRQLRASPACARCHHRRGKGAVVRWRFRRRIRAPARAAPPSCFSRKNYKQRPGLLLLNGIVYLAWASHCDIGRYHGWLMAYDAQTLQQVGVYNNTPNGNQGAFWHGGAAPAVDENGNIYLVAGNGTFDYRDRRTRPGRKLHQADERVAWQSGLFRAVQFRRPEPARSRRGLGGRGTARR